MDPRVVFNKLARLLDLNTDNITENVRRINSNNPDARLRYIMERLVHNLHEFARETRLSTTEWMAGIEFLTAMGKICGEERQVRFPPVLPDGAFLSRKSSILTLLRSQEFILLSDTLGLSLLVDAMDHPKPVNGTEGTVLGPFHTHKMPERRNGELIMQNDPDGTPVLVVCKIRDFVETLTNNPRSGLYGVKQTLRFSVDSVFCLLDVLRSHLQTDSYKLSSHISRATHIIATRSVSVAGKYIIPLFPTDDIDRACSQFHIFSLISEEESRGRCQSLRGPPQPPANWDGW
jgi:hypothetical protein